MAGALALLHFTWRVKKDLTEPLAYAAVLAVLLATRIVIMLGERSRNRRGAGGGRQITQGTQQTVATNRVRPSPVR